LLSVCFQYASRVQDGSEFARAVATFEAACTSPRDAAAAAAAVAAAYRPLMPKILEDVAQKCLRHGPACPATRSRAAALMVAAAEVAHILPPLKDQILALAERLPDFQKLLEGEHDVPDAEALAHALLLLLSTDARHARLWGHAALLPLLLHAQHAVRWAGVRACSLTFCLSGQGASALERRVLVGDQADECWQAWEAHMLRLEVRSPSSALHSVTPLEFNVSVLLSSGTESLLSSSNSTGVAS
jgi:hypothetical protein